MSTIRSLVVALSAQTANFSGPMKSAEKQVKELKASGNDLQDTMKGLDGVMQLAGADAAAMSGYLGLARAAQDAAGLAAGLHGLALKGLVAIPLVGSLVQWGQYLLMTTSNFGLATTATLVFRTALFSLPFVALAAGVSALVVGVYQYISATAEAAEKKKQELDRQKEVMTASQQIRDEFNKLVFTERELAEQKLINAGATKAEVAANMALYDETVKLTKAKKAKEEAEKAEVERKKAATAAIERLREENIKLSAGEEALLRHQAAKLKMTESEERAYNDLIKRNQELKAQEEAKKEAEQAAKKLKADQESFLKQQQEAYEKEAYTERELVKMEAERLKLSEEQVNKVLAQYDAAQRLKKETEDRKKAEEAIKKAQEDRAKKAQEISEKHDPLQKGMREYQELQKMLSEGLIGRGTFDKEARDIAKRTADSLNSNTSAGVITDSRTKGMDFFNKQKENEEQKQTSYLERIASAVERQSQNQPIGQLGMN